MCSGNLRRLSFAFAQYAKDYDGKFPVHDVKNVGVTRSAFYSVNAWPQGMQSYTNGLTVFFCGREEHLKGTCFYLNARASGTLATDFGFPASGVLLTEGTSVFDCSKAVARRPQRDGNPPPFARHKSRGFFHREDGSNYLFVDGHVRWLATARAPGTGPASAGIFTFGS